MFGFCFHEDPNTPAAPSKCSRKCDAYVIFVNQPKDIMMIDSGIGVRHVAHNGKRYLT